MVDFSRGTSRSNTDCCCQCPSIRKKNDDLFYTNKIHTIYKQTSVFVLIFSMLLLLLTAKISFYIRSQYAMLGPWPLAAAERTSSYQNFFFVSCYHFRKIFERSRRFATVLFIIIIYLCSRIVSMSAGAETDRFRVGYLQN
jgi:hypothetical protein